MRIVVRTVEASTCQGFLFDVLIRFEMSIGPADLDRSLVQRPVAILAVAFDDAHGNTLRN